MVNMAIKKAKVKKWQQCKGEKNQEQNGSKDTQKSAILLCWGCVSCIMCVFFFSMLIKTPANLLL